MRKVYETALAPKPGGFSAKELAERTSELMNQDYTVRQTANMISADNMLSEKKL